MHKHNALMVCAVAVLLTVSFVGASASSEEVTTSSPTQTERSVTIPLEFARPLVTEIGDSRDVEVQGCEQKMNAYMAPVLPYRTVSLKLPIEARNVRLEIRDAISEQFQVESPVELSAGPVPLSEPSLFEPQPSPLFADTKWFPNRWADLRISGGRDLDDWGFKKFVSIAVYPVRYLASERKIEWLSSAKLEVIYEVGDKPAESRGADDEVWDLLIIAPEEYAGILGGLVFHKNLRGVRTTLVTLEEAVANPNGMDDAEKLKRFIADHVETYSTRYVLAVGDSDIFPVRYADVWDNYDDYSNTTDGHVVPSDLYFSDLFDEDMQFSTWNGNKNGLYGESKSQEANIDDVDLMPDVLFSRLPISRTVDLHTMVSHIINYELNVDSTSPSFNDVVLCGSVISGPDAEGEYACNQLASSAFAGYNSQELYTTTTFSRDAALLDNSVLDYISDGCGFATYVGHGVYQAWAFGMSNYLFSTQVKDLTNEDMLPFVSAASCETAGFDNESWEHPKYPSGGDSIAEEFVLCTGGGAIAYAGATRVAYGAGGGLSWNLFYIAKINRLLFEAHRDGYRTVGEMFNRAVEKYVTNWWTPSVYDMKTVMEFVTFGDPSVKIGGELESLSPPVSVQLDAPKLVHQKQVISLDVSCHNFGDEREVLLAIAVCSPQGELLFYPNWEAEMNLAPLTLAAGLKVDDFTLTTLDTSLCEKGYNAIYIGLLDPDTLSLVSNLGGSCIYVQ